MGTQILHVPQKSNVMAFDKSLNASMVAEAPELVLGQGTISVQRAYF